MASKCTLGWNMNDLGTSPDQIKVMIAEAASAGSACSACRHNASQCAGLRVKDNYHRLCLGRKRWWRVFVNWGARQSWCLRGLGHGM